MTVPTVVITVEGGVIQDISTTHQVRVVVLEDAYGYEPDDIFMVTGEPWAVQDSTVMPSPGTDAWIAEVLAGIERKERP